MTTKTIGEQIADLENTRAAKAARMEAVMAKSIEEGRSTDEAEAEEFDTLEGEIKTIDADLSRLKALERMQANKATAVAGKTPADAGRSREGVSAVAVRAKEEPGIAFAKYARVIGAAKGNLMLAERMAEAQGDQRITNIVKAAVAAGSTSDATWAGNLVGDESAVFADFVAYLRPQTILGRFGAGGIPALRSVPFRVPLIGETSGGAGYWVGEGKAKPLTKFGYSRTTLEPLKVANIAVLTEEVLKYSNPSADALVRDSLAAALRERLDIDFVDPAKAAAANVSPASVTNGVAAIPATGTGTADDVRTDLRALFSTFIAANNAPTSGVFIMSATTALALSLMMNALGQPEFPSITMAGGTLNGLPVIVSEYIPTDSTGSLVLLVNAQDIYLGDEGGVAIDISREASLQMDDAPTNDSVTPTGTSLVSLWQTNSVGIRAERVINWSKRRASAVAYLSGVNWGA